MKRLVCTCVLILGVALFGLNGVFLAQGGGGDPYLAFEYDGNMNFGVSILKDPTGKVVKKQLTFSEKGASNSTVIRIDGKDLPLTDSGGKWTTRDSKIPNGSKSVWLGQGIEVSQILEIKPGKDGRLDTLVIRYVIENKDSRAHNVGIRVMIDSAIGSSANDGVPFRYAGSNELITTLKDFRAGIPEWVEALENASLQNPGTIAHLTCKLGGSVEAPSRVSITHWTDYGDYRWELPMKSILEGNRKDSCLVLYWNEGQLGPNQKREVGYAYGTQSAPSQPPGGGGSCPMTFAREGWNSNPWGKITIKVEGNRATANYESRAGNKGTWDGTVAGNVLNGSWKDPQASGKVNIVLANDGCSWSGTYTTDGAGGPSTGTSGMDPGKGGTPPGEPWNSPQGQACFEKWMAETLRRLNSTDLGPNWNSRKPFSFNKYGIVEDKKLKSSGAPDVFSTQYKNNKYWFMWDYGDYQVDQFGNYPPNFDHWNKAKVPPIRDYVTKCVGDSSSGPGPITPEPPLSDGMILLVNEYKVLQGQEVVVPIYLIRPTTVKNMNWTLSYNSGIATLVEPKVVQGNLPLTLFEANPRQDGFVRMGFAQTDPLNDSGTVAVLRFKAVGPPGSKTPLTLAVSEVNNPDRAPLPIKLIHGFIEIVKDITDIPRGSCYGRTQLGIEDARCALQMSVGNREVSLQMDMNNDGQVTSQDAAIILQQVLNQTRLGQ